MNLGPEEMRYLNEYEKLKNDLYHDLWKDKFWIGEQIFFYLKLAAQSFILSLLIVVSLWVWLGLPVDETRHSQHFVWFLIWATFVLFIAAAVLVRGPIERFVSSCMDEFNKEWNRREEAEGDGNT